MKILIVSQRYWPENFRITDIAEELAKRDNDVTVLTGLPNYPKGYIFVEYKNGKNRIQEHNGVKIVRSYERPRKHGLINRFLNYYSFPLFAKKTVRKMNHDFDVVMVNETSPILSCGPAIYYKKKYGSRIVMYETDLWPESLLAGGVKKDGIIYNFYKRKSINIYNAFDSIAVATNDHIDYIQNYLNCSKPVIGYLPQYAETIFEKEKCENKDHGNLCNIIFAGNIGKAQSCNTIVEAANLIKENKNIFIHIYGDGSEKESVSKQAKDYMLSNVIFHGSKPLNEMPKIYSSMDAAIVSLENNSYARMTIPGKVQSYLASGLPIISCASGATNNLVSNHNVGFVSESEDASSLAEAILSFYHSKEQNNMSSLARNLYIREFNRNAFFEKLEKVLKGE